MTDEIEQSHRDDLARTVRATPKPQGTRIEKIRSVVSSGQASRVEGLFLDITTANMLINIHDALSPANQVTFVALPLRKMVQVGWKLVK